MVSSKIHSYGMATISRLLKIIRLFCRISSLLQGSFAKETYNFKEPTSYSHPIYWSSSNTLHHTASHCITLHHAAPHCITLLYTASLCITLHQTSSEISSNIHNRGRALVATMIALQLTATHCNTPQHTTTHHNTLSKHQVIFIIKVGHWSLRRLHCITLHHTATHCIALQHTASHCITLQHAAAHCNTLQHTATHCQYFQ